MRAERVSEHIWSLKSSMLLFIPVHVWVVVDGDGVTLVDAGISSMSKGILDFIAELNVGPLQRILLTHGHSDHVGSIKHILEKTPVPVYAHGIEFPFMEGDLPYPRRKKAVTAVPKGTAQPLPEGDDDDLESMAGLNPYLTPGHSPGHVVYYHEGDEVLLAGDLFTSKAGKLHWPMPMFTADMAEAVRSSAIVEKLKPKRLEVCHGDAVMNPAAQWKAYIERTAARFSIAVRR